MKKLLIWLAANVFNIIGGLMIGLGIPFVNVILFKRETELIMLFIGILLMGISYYYKFIYKQN